MQPDYDERDFGALWDMRLYARQTLEIVRGRSQADLGEPELRYALERVISIIGEAAARVSLSFREAHPDVPWQQIIGMRNIIVHQYAVVELDIVWRVVTESLPALLAQIDPLVEDAEKLITDLEDE